MEWIRLNAIPSYGGEYGLAHGAKASEFNDDFHFALYLRVHLDALIMELIEIQPTTWIFVIFLLIIHAALARSQLLGEWIIYFPPLVGIAMLVALHVALTFYERIYCDEDRVRRSRLERAASGKLAVSKAESNHDLEDMLLRVIQALLLFCMYSVGSHVVSKHVWKARHDPGYDRRTTVVGCSSMDEIMYMRGRRPWFGSRLSTNWMR